MRLKLRTKVFGLASVISILTLAIGQYAFAIINLDPSFGTNGVTITSYGHDANIATSGMVLQSDGKTVVVGYASNGTNNDWAIARYNTDGTLDSSFGSGGKVVEDFGDNDALGGVAIQSDGKIVVGGYTRTAPGNAGWTLERFNSNGTSDLSFGTLGLVRSFTSDNGILLGVAIQTDGKIVAVGHVSGPDTVSDDVAVARYNSDGSPDNTFGNAGTVTFGLNQGDTPNDRGNALAIQADGKIVIFGDYDTGFHVDNVVLARLNANGSLDGTFGNGGIQTDNFSSHNGGRAVAIQSDGKIVVVGGTCVSGLCDSYIARYTTSGVRDTTFGTNGVTIHSYMSGSDGANALAIQSDGKIVIAGGGTEGTANEGYVSRYNTDGTIDTSFGSNGTFIPGFSSNGDGLNSVLLQSDGKIIVGGAASNGSYNDWVVARITTGPVPSTRPQVFIMIPGIDTSLVKGQVSTTDFAPIQFAITQAVPNAQFITYSYSGFSGNKDIKPKAYSCVDTHSNPINSDIQTLDKEIQAIVSRQPNAQIYLVGHSLGGVVALGYMGALQAGAVSSLAGNNLAGVITLDSPIGGVPANAVYSAVEGAFFLYNCPGYSPALDNAARDLATINGSATGSPLGGTANVLSIPSNKKGTPLGLLGDNDAFATIAHNGTASTNVLTVGNTLDRLWVPGICDLNISPFPDTQWLTNQGDGSGIYARAITSSAFNNCAEDLLDNVGNHKDVLSNSSVLQGIQQFVTGQTPSALAPAP